MDVLLIGYNDHDGLFLLPMQALHYRKYSTATDVWSFGVLLYEIWSLGRTPFMDKSPEQVIASQKHAGHTGKPLTSEFSNIIV